MSTDEDDGTFVARRVVERNDEDYHVMLRRMPLPDLLEHAAYYLDEPEQDTIVENEALVRELRERAQRLRCFPQ